MPFINTRLNSIWLALLCVMWTCVPTRRLLIVIMVINGNCISLALLCTRTCAPSRSLPELA
jgi:hypothetical protein